MKKDNKTKKNNRCNNKKIICIIVITIIILAVLIITLIFGNNKKIICSKKINDKKIVMNNNIVVNLNGKKIKNIKVKKNIKIDDNTIDYLSALQDSLENNYKKQEIKYSMERKGNELIANLTYDKKKEYILDNLYVDLQDAGMNINIISEDNENIYGKLNIGKEYEYENIIKILEKANYVCK